MNPYNDCLRWVLLSQALKMNKQLVASLSKHLSCRNRTINHKFMAKLGYTLRPLIGEAARQVKCVLAA